MPYTQNKHFSEPIDCNKIAESAPINGQLYHFNSLDSTNTWLQKNGKCGDICISNQQTAGRGRRGNKWISPDTGNIYFSLMWCFDSPIQQIKHVSLLGLTVGLAVAEALHEVGLQNHGVKWPNDIYWQQQKMGGILLENTSPSNKVIIGIGLNINMPEDQASQVDQAITCLSKAFKNQRNCVNRNQLIISMIKHLNQRLIDFTSLSFDDFKDDWDKCDILKNKEVNFQYNKKQISATVVGLNQQGQLGLLDFNNQLHYYSSADIRLNKPL